MKKIHITSLDYDGCLYAKKPTSMQDYITTNQWLLDNVIKEAQKQFDEKKILVGSNRQTTDRDAFNGLTGIRGTGSCFLAVDHISKYLASEFDSFLLSDIYLNKKPGYTVTAFLDVVTELGWENRIFGPEEFSYLSKHEKLSYVNSSKAGQFVSEDKINILYAQIHKIASENPSAEITFDFYDDKDFILQHLTDFYKRYPNLIAKNVTLRVFQYQSGINSIKPYGVISGTGKIDNDYYQTVLNMGKIAEKEEPLANGDGKCRPYIMSGYLTPERLEALQCLEDAKTTQDEGESHATCPGFFKPAAKETISLVKIKTNSII